MGRSEEMFLKELCIYKMSASWMSEVLIPKAGEGNSWAVGDSGLSTPHSLVILGVRVQGYNLLACHG